MSNLQVIIDLLIVCVLSILGFLSVFFPKKVIEGFLYFMQNKNGNPKFEFVQRLTQKKWLLINFRSCGIAMLLMAIIIVWIFVANRK
jgi:hypothetical protein